MPVPKDLESDKILTIANVPHDVCLNLYRKDQCNQVVRYHQKNSIFVPIYLLEELSNIFGI